MDWLHHRPQILEGRSFREEGKMVSRMGREDAEGESLAWKRIPGGCRTAWFPGRRPGGSTSAVSPG